MDLEGIIQIGTIINSHGIKGELKVLPETDDLELIGDLKHLYLLRQGERKRYVLEGVRPFKQYWLIKLRDIDDMTAAQLLKGSGIFTEEENVRPLAEDEFYIHDLINLKVYSTEGQYLGQIVNFFEAGTQGICEVQTEEDSFLFPTSAEVLVEIIPSEKAVINLVPELRNLNKRTAG